ncbi:hypothetical protein M0804_003429 [Polistes exclamans]|nr:hypothetical protein M0804_003429 [Polistes exclamans]
MAYALASSQAHFSSSEDVASPLLDSAVLPTTSTLIGPTAAWPRQEQPCPIAGDFCMNGGTCLFFETVGEPACRCADGFTGLRCETKDISTGKDDDDDDDRKRNGNVKETQYVSVFPVPTRRKPSDVVSRQSLIAFRACRLKPHKTSPPQPPISTGTYLPTYLPTILKEITFLSSGLHEDTFSTTVLKREKISKNKNAQQKKKKKKYCGTKREFSIRSNSNVYPSSRCNSKSSSSNGDCNGGGDGDGSGG